MTRLGRKILGLVAIVTFILSLRCDRAVNYLSGPTQPSEEKVTVEEDFRLEIEKAIWKDDLPAAYTIAFDDTKASHFQIAAPELQDRGIRATFNLNTKYVINWNDWRRLAAVGHEIASHTYSHANCIEITAEELHRELQRAIQDILSNIPEVTRVPSFTYPFGLHTDFTHTIVAQYHLNARRGWGINAPEFPDEGLILVKGIGVYPPFDMNAINAQVDKAIAMRGWILVYFHMISIDGTMEKYIIPVERFFQHIDYVAAISESLWIAPQGEVADYIRMRRSATVTGSIWNHAIIHLSVDHIPTDVYQNLYLTIKMSMPKNWKGHEVVIVGLKKEPYATVRLSADHLFINVKQSTDLELRAIKKISYEN